MFIYLLIFNSIFVVCNSEDIVVTVQGQLKGVQQDGYVSFTGIPYASINKETGRFKKAGLAPFWLGLREPATPSCSPSSTIEECLRVDVHVPAAGAAPWPVLVWVRSGPGHFRPRALVQQGVIVVMVAHRLGPVGFLCLKEEEIPGNAGAKDVILALQWVRDNIVAFRGNPAKIIVAGQGFGAAIIEALMLSPASQGLFQGVILQSGTVLSPWTFNYDAEDRARILAQMLSDDDDIATTLLNSNIADLVTQSFKLKKPYFPFGLCVEKGYKREQSLISDLPYNLLVSKRVYSVPMIIGYNSDEAYIFASNIREARAVRRLSMDMTFILPEELNVLSEREKQQIARRIRDVYFKNNRTMASLLTYYRDAYLLSHIYRSARLHATASHQPVYLYQFSYSGEVGVDPEPDVPKTGAAHSDELAYLFSGREFDGEDGQVQKKLAKLWTNFAKYMTPTPIPRAGEASTWDPVDAHNPHLLNIGAELKMQAFAYSKEMRLWDDIYEKYANSVYQSETS